MRSVALCMLSVNFLHGMVIGWSGQKSLWSFYRSDSNLPLSRSWGTQRGSCGSEDGENREREKGWKNTTTYRSYTPGSTGQAHIPDQHTRSVGKLTANTEPLHWAHSGTSHMETPGNTARWETKPSVATFIILLRLIWGLIIRGQTRALIWGVLLCGNWWWVFGLIDEHAHTILPIIALGVY